MLWYIEALRALAVVAVVIFHSSKEVLPGGFLGVDVFFVVSGYLMAYLVVKNQTKDFKVIDFIWRRFSRLAPSMLVLILSVIIINVFIQPEFYISEYLDSAISALVYISNINFWFGSGYFNVEQKFDPLLHTWTLGVEFQYYIAFAIVTYLMKGVDRKYLIAIFSLASILSFFLNIYFAEHFSAIFYNLPTRGWEFGIGAILGFMLSGRNKSDFIDSKRAEVIIYFFLSFIVILFVNYQLEFDRLYYTLLVCLSTGMVLIVGIYANIEASSRKLNGIFLTVGKLSYTVYLAHYPIIIFLSPYLQSKFLVICVSLLLSFSIAQLLSPFENKSRRYMYSFQTLKKKALALSVYLVLPLTLYVNNQNLIDLNANISSKRMTADQQKVQKLYLSEIKRREQAVDDFNKANNKTCWQSYQSVTAQFSEEFERCRDKYGNAIIVLGDSHSEGLFLTLSSNIVNREDYPFVFGINSGGCRYSLGSSQNCFKGVDDFLKANTSSIDSVLYHQAGFYLLERKGTRAVGRAILDSTSASNSDLVEPSTQSISLVFAKLKQLSEYNKTIWVGPWIDPFINRRKAIESGCSQPVVMEDWINSSYKSLDEGLHSSQVTEYVSLIKLLDIDYKNEFLTCDELYWADTDHMTVTGHRHFSSRLSLGDIVESE
ncbi:acyltransferase family protein [Vibrio splendidus]|uniref:acyltransferase family protein n=1 Tax=Vibrio splendidus TaxID=29497 RepID=UPI0021186B9E|nr:acyltransferase family protein [Vibrio splendidus]MCQ8869373.1 acyltransferase [Vibrio splendidus]